MIRKLALVNAIVLIAMLSASPAGAKTESVSFTINGAGSVSSGACTVGGYGSTCRSGACMCLTVESGKVSGSFTGSSEVFATIDTGNSELQCQPVFITANATLIHKKVTQTSVLDLLAALCPAGAHQAFTGGWGIESSSDQSTGKGTLTGTFNRSNNKVSITLKGTIQ
jgi:hypothetical protein